ncbi:MAG: MFS transporter [Leptospirales bacterium]|nr:MFS transporter [Leptospirales bacterium]
MTRTSPSTSSLLFFYFNSFSTLLVANMLIYSLVLLSGDLGASHGFTGLVVMCNNLPALVFGLIAGALLDRISRMAVMFGAQCCFIVSTWALYWLHSSGILQADTRWLLILISLLNGIGLTFLIPGRLAVLANLVPEGSAGRSTIILNVLIILGFGFGPPIAGQLRQRLDWNGTLLVTAIAYLFAFATLLPVRPTEYIRGKAQNVLASFVEGLRYSWSAPLIREMIVLQMIVFMVVGPIQALVPEYARHTLGLDEAGRGGLMAALGFGLLLGGILARILHQVRHRGRVMLAAAAPMCLFLAASSSSQDWRIAAICLALAGIGGGLLGALIPSAVQVAAPDHMRGRVMGVYGMFFQLMPGVGAFFSGRAADALHGTGPGLVATGLFLAACSLAAAALLGHLRAYD